MNLFTKQEQTHRLIQNELMVAKEEGWGGGDSQGVWDGHVHTAIFKMDNQQGPNVQHRKLCLMLKLCVTWQLEWDGSLGENGYIYLYG